jgi:hypothetical protein
VKPNDVVIARVCTRSARKHPLWICRQVSQVLIQSIPSCRTEPNLPIGVFRLGVAYLSAVVNERPTDSKGAGFGVVIRWL